MAMAVRITGRPPFEVDVLNRQRGYSLDLLMGLSPRVLWHLYRQEFGKYSASAETSRAIRSLVALLNSRPDPPPPVEWTL